MRLALADDRETVASMIRYPRTLVVNGEERTLENAEDFLAHYEEILPADFVKTLESLLSQPLSYRYDGTFLGDGALWMSNAGGELLIESLFPSETVQMKPMGELMVGVEPGLSPELQAKKEAGRGQLPFFACLILYRPSSRFPPIQPYFTVWILPQHDAAGGLVEGQRHLGDLPQVHTGKRLHIQPYSAQRRKGAILKQVLLPGHRDGLHRALLAR